MLRIIPTVTVCGIGLAACNWSAEPPEPPEPPGTGSTELRFVVEITEQQSPNDVSRAAAQVLQGPVDVEPLFPEAAPSDDPAGLSRIYLVTSRTSQPPANPWDLAHALRDTGNFPAVEPDFENALAEVTARSSAAKGCNDEGVPAPGDRGWSLRAVNAPAAWQLEPKPGGKRFGEGVWICHADTGWTDHVDLDRDRLDLDKAWNTLDDTADAEDPLDYAGHPGHGTATGSVFMSSGGISDTDTTGPGGVTGIASKSTVVPIRTMRNVVHFLDSDVAQAVHRATLAGCDVTSMSLGGRAFFGLERAIRDAVSKDTVVVAAAGNCVGFVVAPAMYRDTVAVAATNFESKPWKGSSHGSVVTISAPGEDVYRAKRQKPADPTDRVEPSDGTSYATAIVAGAAALWIAHNDDDGDGSGNRQARFVEALRATARRPADWDAGEYGAGIVDLAALLSHAPTAPVVEAPRPPATADRKYVELLSRQTDLPAGTIRTGLERLLGAEGFREKLARVGPELLYIASTQPEAFRRSVETAEAPSGITGVAAARSILAPHSSETLSALLAN